MKTITYFCLLVFCLTACKQTDQQKTTDAELEITEEASYPLKAWIDKRVAKAEERLNQTEAGKLVWQALQAHGGLQKFYGNGYLAFQFNYQPLGQGTGRNTHEVVDTWSNKARHSEVDNPDMQYGWNGKVAWEITPDGSPYPYDTRFWALTPYYFLGLPFVLDGQGVNLEKMESVNFKEAPQDVVRVTFDPGTGDAPDDYYILYFDQQTHLLSVIRYAVSYPGYFQKGQRGNERFMEVTGYKQTSGITFPTGYKTYMSLEDGSPGQYVTEITVSNLSFQNKVPDDYFNPPSNARLVEIQPRQ